MPKRENDNAPFLAGTERNQSGKRNEVLTEFCALDFGREIVAYRDNISNGLDRTLGEHPAAIKSAANCNRIFDVLVDQMNEIEIAVRVCSWMLRHKELSKSHKVFGRIANIFATKGCWNLVMNTFDRMNEVGVDGKVKIYNSVITVYGSRSQHKEAELLYKRMRADGIHPNQGTLKAMIKVCEKMTLGSKVKTEMPVKKALGYLKELRETGEAIDCDCYVTVINMLSRSGNWQATLKLLNEVTENPNKCSPNMFAELSHSAMHALQNGMQWERTLNLFEDMRSRKLATTQTYTIALTACEKGFQWRQCLQYLDDMEVEGVRRDSYVYGAAMSCMEKAGLVDIVFKLMDQMKIEGISPNRVAFNSAIQACARCSNGDNCLWQRGFELFQQVRRPVKIDSYNAVLDALSFQEDLSRDIFSEGMKKGTIRPSSHISTDSTSAKLDLHLFSLSAAELCVRWWFEEHLLEVYKSPQLKTVDIVTGWGKSRLRENREGDDSIKKRVSSLIGHYGMSLCPQSRNKGMIRIDIETLKNLLKKNCGRLVFDSEGYYKWKRKNTPASSVTQVPQVLRKRRTLNSHSDQRNTKRRKT